jgi:hypothetical protein
MNYRYVDLPNIDNIAQEILKKLPLEHRKKNMFKGYPTDFFDIKPLRDAVETITPWDNIHDIALVSTKPHSFLPTHIDYHDLLKETIYALNIPIYNCDNTHVVFYRVTKENILAKHKTQEHGNADDYCEYAESDVEEIEKFYLNTAALFNTQVPHKAINNTNEPRIVLTIRFKSKLDINKIPILTL